MLIRIVAALLAPVVVSLGLLTAAEATIIDTTGGDGGAVAPFGDPNTATFGQTFTLSGSDTLLSSFSLYLGAKERGSDTLDFRGYVAAWNGVQATSILFESDTRTINAAAGAPQEFVFFPDINLVSGNKYVLFLSISHLPDQPESLFRMPAAVGDPIPGTSGTFVFLNSGQDFAALTTSFWSAFGNTDLWFKAELLPERQVAVPEPATLALFGAGLAGLGWLSRRSSAASR